MNIEKHLQNQNYDGRTKVLRVLWALAGPLFRHSPRPLYAWRNFLLKLFGAKIGTGVRFYPSAQVMYPWNLEVSDHVVVGWDVRLYSLGKIKIGRHVLISQGAHLCAGSHDYQREELPLLTPEIVVEEQTWLASECFIAGGVRIGAGSVVGARAVVVRDVPASVVVAGNPARIIKQITKA